MDHNNSDVGTMLFNNVGCPFLPFFFCQKKLGRVYTNIKNSYFHKGGLTHSFAKAAIDVACAVALVLVYLIKLLFVFFFNPLILIGKKPY